MYDDADSIMVYMMSAPETARMIREFESVQCSIKRMSTKHQEDARQMQIRFLNDVKNVILVVEEKVNVFTDKGQHLKCIDTRDVMEPGVKRISVPNEI